jgi:putative ABC transport system permease protein
VAVVPAAFGLFSVASYAIAHRSREFSIRIALGATRHAVLRKALQSTAAVASGLAIGLTLSRVLKSVLVRWSTCNMDDPLVLAAVVGALPVTSMPAALIPARRATAIEPVTVLKSE